MFKKIGELFGKQRKALTIYVRKGPRVTPIICQQGDNLMDVTNSMVNSDANIFGLCDKQLACTTCRVDLLSHQSQAAPPSQQEIDVLLTTYNYNQQTSRMACQIFLTEQMNGVTVRIDPDPNPSYKR